jgi:hypothetical protein
MPRKDDYTRGLEVILNNPKTSFLRDSRTFHEIHKASEMSLSSMIKHVGRGARSSVPKPPTDKEKSETRIKEMEAKNEDRN